MPITPVPITPEEMKKMQELFRTAVYGYFTEASRILGERNFRMTCSCDEKHDKVMELEDWVTHQIDRVINTVTDNPLAIIAWSAQVPLPTVCDIAGIPDAMFVFLSVMKGMQARIDSLKAENLDLEMRNLELLDKVEPPNQ